jgi:hypothetical protein
MSGLQCGALRNVPATTLIRANDFPIYPKGDWYVI